MADELIVRLQQHQQALVNIEINSNDPEAIARQEALLQAAQEMEQASLRKRAGQSGSDVSMVDCMSRLPPLYVKNVD